jgi:hypothetical protein
VADRPPDPGSKGDTGVGPGREYPGIPRWVRVFAIIAAAVILAFVFTLVTEGPMRPGMPMDMPMQDSGGGHNPFDRGH